MATVISVPQDSKLQFVFVTGTNPQTGAPIKKTKTFTKVKNGASDQDIYDVATQLINLQKYTVDEVRLLRVSVLTE